jgi:hypothetical protein
MSGRPAKRAHRGLWEIFRIPLALAAISGAGLIEALLVAGSADILWSLAIALPLAVVLYALFQNGKK